MRPFWPSVALVMLWVLAAACGGAPASPAPAAQTGLVWHTLGTWSGRGSSQTGSFDVTTGALRVTWKTQPPGGVGAGRFRVALHSAVSGRPLQIVVDTTGAGGETAYVQDEPRVSYLEIEADALEWQVTVEEATSRPAGR